jgi:hypothetical protein
MLSAFSVTSDLASCTRCTGMRSVSLSEFRRRVSGRPFRFLLRYHLRRHDEERLRQGLEGSLAVLPPALRSLALETGERWREETAAGALAPADCASLLDRVEEAARSAEGVSAPLGGDQTLDVFEVATLTVVLAAREDEGLREEIGETAPGLVSRYGWNLVAAAALGWGATVVEDPVWTAVVWAGLGLALLPPVARLVAEAGADEGA